MICERVISLRPVRSMILMVLFLGSCSLGGPLREDVKASGYTLGKKPRSWREESPENTQGKDTNGADHVFQDHTTKSMIALNSLCFRYESTSLARLAHQFENGLKNAETLSEEELSVDGRSGVRVHIKGDFDGVPSEVLVVELRKNDCLFDFSLVGVSPLKSDLIHDFDEWVQGFRYTNAEEKRPEK